MTLYPHAKVLITGGAGFIGSHLVTACLQQNIAVVVLDDFSTGLPDNIPAHPLLTVLKGSILDSTLCCDALDDVSCIFHLAAKLSVPESVTNPFLYYETNIRGTYNLLEAARQRNVQYFIFSSSAAVYGNVEGICDEDTTPCAPLSPYGSSKLIGEQLCREYGALYNIRSACLRYFNVYGPRQRSDTPYASLMSKIMHNMEHNKPIVIYGDGLQQRDFVAVEQIVQANLMIGKLLMQHTWHGEPINIASGTSRTVRDMITHIHALFPYYDLNNIHFTDARPGDIKYSAAYCAKYDRCTSLLK